MSICCVIIYLQVSSTNKKLEDNITNAVIEELAASCAECGITDDIIDEQSFACFPESPTYTSETDSGSLISLIEEWVSGGTSIIVTGVLVTVDSECSVAISSLSEGECSPTQPPTTDTSTAIIGGVVAVIVIVSVAITITIIAVTLIVKNRHNNMSIQK